MPADILVIDAGSSALRCLLVEHPDGLVLVDSSFDQSGEFAREWILENQAGRPVFNALRRIEAEHPIEEVGKKLRSMMSWLKR